MLCYIPQRLLQCRPLNKLKVFPRWTRALYLQPKLQESAPTHNQRQPVMRLVTTMHRHASTSSPRDSSNTSRCVCARDLKLSSLTSAVRCTGHVVLCLFHMLLLSGFYQILTVNMCKAQSVTHFRYC